jgi:hypothetical protein
MAQFNIKQVLDVGQLHEFLHPNSNINFEIQQDIPKCFKLDLSEYGSPLNITIHEIENNEN